MCSGNGLDEYPQQNILKSFFEINSLEFLKIDSYGMKEKWLSSPELEEYKVSFKNNSDNLELFENKLRVNEQNHTYLLKRRKMEIDDLNGINKLINLKELSIQFNDLEEFPLEIFALKRLKKIHIYGNNLPENKVDLIKKNDLKIITSFSN